MDDIVEIKNDLSQLARLALAEKPEDVRLYVARLVRKYRKDHPDFVRQMNEYLKANSPRVRRSLRKAEVVGDDFVLPVDAESQLSLLKEYKDNPDAMHLIMPKSLERDFLQLIEERKQIKRLSKVGLHPTRSAIFVGKPGVGKTLTSRWLAAQLALPFYVLDLTTVMSSLLGKSGSNLRAVFDFARRSPCVLLLDEIDAIAKRRSDDSDVGELKRLVTVILQELDEWPSESLLLAATNHPELIDPALWRRFDHTIHFSLPDDESIREAIGYFLRDDAGLLNRWGDILAYAFEGESFSDIERSIQKLRRMLALGAGEMSLIKDYLKSCSLTLDKTRRIDFAVLLANQTKLSQHAISDITGVSRDTIRKYSKHKK